MHPKIKDMHVSDMPRERLLHLGPDRLSNAELLAVILRTGTAKKNAIALASEVLVSSGGLRGLSKMSAQELKGFKGMGEGKTSQVMAAIELSRRLAGIEKPMRFAFKSPEDVYYYLRNELKFQDREHFLVLGLNTKNEVIGKHLVSIGTLNQTLVHPREVFNWAIKSSAASILLAHNHPSGHVEPSKEDEQLTKRMVEAGQLLGIKVVDHIIIGESNYYSLKANCKM